MALFDKSKKQIQESKGILSAFSVDVIKWEPETDQEASMVSKNFTGFLISGQMQRLQW